MIITTFSTYLPVEARPDVSAQHAANVGQVAVNAVDPGNGHYLSDGNGKCGVRDRPAVHQLENVDAGLKKKKFISSSLDKTPQKPAPFTYPSTHGQTAEKHDQADKGEHRQLALLQLFRPKIDQRADNRLGDGENGAKAEGDQHQKEDHRPKGSVGEAREGRWVGDKGEADALVGGLVNWLANRLGHEANDAEDGKTGVDAGQRVGDDDEEGVAEKLEKLEKKFLKYLQ